MEKYRAWLCRRGRERSADQYCRVARRWLDDPDELSAIIVSRSYAPNYRRFLVACVRAWGKFTKDKNLAEQLDSIKLPAPVPTDVREPLEFNEWFDVRGVIDNAEYLDDATRLVCSLIALRGIRCGDVLRLTKRDIQRALKTGRLAFESKGERWQDFNAEPLRPYLEELVALQWPGKRVCDLVTRGSAESAGRKVRRAFDRVATALDVEPEDLYAHRFRHTYATYFLQQMHGDPEAIFKLQQQMGWARLDTAANYLRRSRRDELNEIESQMLSGSRKTHS
jgi:integrase